MKKFLSQQLFVWPAMLLVTALFASLLFPSTAARGTKAGDEVFIIKTVILVRHAEKTDEPGGAAPLSQAGIARSQKLAGMLSSAGVKAIYTTQYLRTKQTAEPLAKQLGIPITPITIQVKTSNPREVSDESIRQIVDKIMGGTENTVLVVGHSNSVPDVIKMLGGDVVPTIDEKRFDDLFVVTVYGMGKAKVLRLQ